ncbi:MAG TPA: helix-turn-helix transcriptional regulator [Solirubrobacteraceae bacterium]|jgi:cytoskeletal protein RodZ
MADIGATLREARMRARIDVSEIEAQTKIRAKYLRALENEEWNLLPGPTFVKSFLRTYANALGLDGKALVEQYRLAYERLDEGDFQVIVAPQRRPRPRSGPRGTRSSRGYTIAVGVFSVLILLLIVLLVTGKPSKKTSATLKPTATSTRGHATAATATRKSPTRSAVSLSLESTGQVYVCLIADYTRRAIPGLELSAGTRTHTYHAQHFDLTLGNNAVKMYVDGRALTVPPSSQPIGYAISANGRRRIPAAQLPTCG